jgi:hypothetical protein
MEDKYDDEGEEVPVGEVGSWISSATAGWSGGGVVGGMGEWPSRVVVGAGMVVGGGVCCGMPHGGNVAQHVRKI